MWEERSGRQRGLEIAGWVGHSAETCFHSEWEMDQVLSRRLTSFARSTSRIAPAAMLQRPRLKTRDSDSDTCAANYPKDDDGLSQEDVCYQKW